MVWATHDDLVCHRHQRWLNPAGLAVGQISVASCPEVLQAQRWHRNLICRSGRQRVLAAYEFSFNRCQQWFSAGYRFPTTLTRLERLDRAAGRPSSMADPQLLAALYPNVIALTAILASPHWRGVGRSTDADDRWKFHQRIIIEVTDGQTPIGPRDNLRNWIYDAPNTYPQRGAKLSLPEILQPAKTS